MFATNVKVSTFLLVFICLAHFAVDLMLGIWPVYKSITQMDLAVAGMIVGVSALIGEGSQLFFGSMTDRKGFHKIFIILGLALTAANAFLAYSLNFGFILIFYLLTCIGSGSFHPAAASFMNSINPQKRGLFMGIFAAAGALGLAVSQLIFTSTYYFTEGATWLLALPAVILSIFLMFSFFPQTTAETQKKRIGPSEVFKFFKKPHLCALYLLQLASQSILWGTIFILPDVLKSMGHPDAIAYGTGHLVLILGGACMMIPAGYLSDRYSAKAVLLIASISGFACLYSFLFFGAFSVWLTLPLLFLTGACLGVVNPVGVSLGNKYEPTNPGAISAFLMGLVWCVSEATGPGIVGVLSSYFADDYAPVKGLAVLGLFFLLQIGTALILPQYVKASDASPSPTPFV